MKKIEIERKFLLKDFIIFNLPREVREKARCFQIHQHYLEDGSRIRSQEEIRSLLEPQSTKMQFIHCKKRLIEPGVFEEEEVELTIFEYTELSNHILSKIVKKRYELPIEAGQSLVVDVYDNLKMVVAEVEYDSKELFEEHFKSKAVPYLIEPLVLLEVTGMPQFYNSNLSKPCF